MRLHYTVCITDAIAGQGSGLCVSRLSLSISSPIRAAIISAARETALATRSHHSLWVPRPSDEGYGARASVHFNPPSGPTHRRSVSVQPGHGGLPSSTAKGGRDVGRSTGEPNGDGARRNGVDAQRRGPAYRNERPSARERSPVLQPEQSRSEGRISCRLGRPIALAHTATASLACLDLVTSRARDARRQILLSASKSNEIVKHCSEKMLIPVRRRALELF